MSNISTIEWTDASLNTITGCTEVSPGCDHCYARVLAERFRGSKAFPQGFDLTFHPERMHLPEQWKKPRRIFVNSMSDLFHKDVPDSHIRDLFRVMAKVDRHTYQVLTKRPSRLVNTSLIERILDDMFCVTGHRAWPAHIWIGVSVESMHYTWRIEKLRHVPAPTRFISAEPLLGPLVLDLSTIRWLITGAESGRGARPMNEDWVRGLRDQAALAHVAFFYKQNARNGHKIPLPELDGKIWNEFPVIFADDEDVKRLFWEVEPEYAKTNQKLADV